eukprot:3440003-Karenia_brevis.AAC.1
MMVVRLGFFGVANWNPNAESRAPQGSGFRILDSGLRHSVTTTHYILPTLHTLHYTHYTTLH